MLQPSTSFKSLALATLLASQVQAQQSKQPIFFASVSPPTPVAATRAKTIVLIGRVETTTGVLPGAVVEVKNTSSLRTVTDADGFFRLTLPATASPVAVVASYAGYEDVSASLVPGAMPAVLRLVVLQDDIKLPHKQQLKSCLRVAQKEIRKQLEQVYQ